MSATLQPAPCRRRRRRARGRITIAVKVEARNPCPVHCHDGVYEGGVPCNCEKPLVGVFEDEYDLGTKQLGQLIMGNILNSGQTITDTGGSARAVAANSACTVPTISAGTSGTAATVADTALGTETETVAAGAPSAGTWSGTSGTFTVAGTVTATANRSYQECGFKVTAATFVFLICHDTFSTLSVSSGGTLAVTYTWTIS